MGVFEVLRRELPALPAEREFSFARHTTIGCGGTAEVAVCPRSPLELARLIRVLEENGIGYLLLGAGANVLPDDGRFEGAVIRFTGMRGVRAAEHSVIAAAGCTGGALLRFAREHGLGGFEPFAGIPMTVGGAVAVNAGVSACYMGELVKRVLAVVDGRLKVLSVADCRFLEKSSIFTGKIAVCAAELSFTPRNIGEIKDREREFLAARAHLPKGRSMGCTFVNPETIPAGKLIDVCGLKGARIGGASVSEVHANFIINEGGSAQDVEALISRIKRIVFQKTGILLREEIRRLSFT